MDGRGLGNEPAPLAQPLDLQLVGNLEEGLERVLGDVDLPKVDEVHEGSEVDRPDVLKQEDRVLHGVDGPEDVAKVGGAGAQNDPMGLGGKRDR